ncbi:MAG: hypothetical protein IJH83_00420, partial [Coriobacteriales bacterium]|nr:hypothetical protein [Coriobacteriales bacterium]
TALQFWRNTALWGWGRQRPLFCDLSLEELSSCLGRRDARIISSDYGLALPLHVLDVRDRRNQTSCTKVHGLPEGVGSFPALVLNDGLSVVTPEVCLMQVTSGKSLVKTTSLVSEFSGNYSLTPGTESGLVMRPPLLSPQDCMAVSKRFAGCWGAKKLQCAAKHAVVNSNSPMETSDAIAMSFPYVLGGLNFPEFELNHRVDLSSEARKLVGSEFLLCDFYFPEHCVAIEYDSDSVHLDPAQHTRDAQRRSALLAMGIQTLTLTRGQNMHMREFDAFMSFVAQTLGHRIHPRCKDYEQRKQDLYRELFYPDMTYA